MTATHDLLHAQYETPPPPPPDDRPSKGKIVFGTVLVASGIAWILDQAGVVDVTVVLVLPLLLASLGVALMVTSYDGPHVGLAIAGVLLTMVVVVGSVAPLDAFRGGIGERRYTPQVVEDLEDYRLGIGSLEIDLTDLSLTTDTELTVEVGIGELILIVPAEMVLDLAADVDAGEVVLFDEVSSGTSVEVAFHSQGAPDSDPRLAVTLDAFIGSIKVERS